MDLKRVEELIELMRRSGVTELALELPDYKIRIRRALDEEQAPSEQEAATAQASAAGQAPARPEVARAVSVVSPVVGVFHNGGMLDPRETIGAGERVRKGQLLAAIEAMKVPNEVRAPVSGLVSKVLVSDGAAVEFGQTLFLIEPEEGGEADEGEPLVGLA
jgi:acetyl-CoA carboxylase biotin carboxyl carrier protein